MPWWAWIIVGIVAVVLAVFVPATISAARGQADPTTVSISPDLDAELRALVGAGRQVEAIRRLRQETGLNLRAAVAIIERMKSAGR